TLSYTLYNDKHNGGALKNIEDPNPDIREVTQDHPAKFKLRSELATFNASYELPFATLKSVTSYQDLTHDQSFDADRLDVATYGGYDHVATWATDAETFMEELTISSLADSPIDWIAGVFYSNTDSAQYVVEYRELGVTAVPALPVLPKDTTPAEIPGNLAYENISTVNRESIAPFFQVTVPVMANLNATLGARYNDDKYEGEGASYYATPTQSSFDTQTWTGKVGLDYDVSEDSMLYASWSRGYKPGGLNGGSSGALTVSTTYDEEIVEAIEFGSKNTFLDGRATLNASIFFNQYENMQFIEEDPIPYSGGIGNIPEAETYGLELEGSFLTFNDQLMLGGNMAMLDGEVTADYEALDRRLADAAAAEAVGTGTIYPWTYDWFLARQSAAVQVKGNTPPNLADLTY
ncbi:TonB-dependent receptor, partial [Cobetia sp. Dlab-2-U]|nr:TonB-dependent receptor [Cobetia sp. Dlab-2-U]